MGRTRTNVSDLNAAARHFRHGQKLVNKWLEENPLHTSPGKYVVPPGIENVIRFTVDLRECAEFDKMMEEQGNIDDSPTP